MKDGILNALIGADPDDEDMDVGEMVGRVAGNQVIPIIGADVGGGIVNTIDAFLDDDDIFDD